ncbi:unnamed protein product [Cylindrotheca closterium]|uniref:tRNA dimethylallyltransferase n=1 Tax=Cylindrotheca closterium TaxID=2856 RepID=A0AAD2CRR8_9STRA|nr:unnamed protein product [Cylindrotheca closterium]
MIGQPKSLLSLSMSSSNNSKLSKNLVVILAGPTATGKSDVAARLCAEENGIIVSADSVQAYRGVQIGANKPSNLELEKTPHLLIDVADCTQNYNAAEWRADARTAIQVLLDPKTDADDTNPRANDVIASVRSARDAKGCNQDDAILPIVCGGTMMYIQWLVHGAPDTMRPSAEASEQAKKTISNFQKKDDFQAAKDHVSSFGQVFKARVEGFCGDDWYRLRRTLEVALTAQTEVDKAWIVETLYTGERNGGLESFGCDVRCFFLCPDDRMGHTKIIDRRCEEMVIKGLLKETAELSLTEQMPEMAARAIGYRQTLDYLSKELRDNKDSSDEFDSFINDFTTATRRYAKKQMSWFRKDKDFMFIPVSLSTIKATRVEEAAAMIRHYCRVSRDEFEKELYSSDSSSSMAKKRNEEQGKGMKLYQFERHILKAGSEEYDECLSQAIQCQKRMQKSKKPKLEASS